MKQPWNAHSIERATNKVRAHFSIPTEKPERTGRIEALYFDEYGKKIGEDRSHEK